MKKELNETQLEGVNGGYVVDAGGSYYVVADGDGSILSKGPVELLATMSAKYQGQSERVISIEEYEGIFGKPFQP